LAFAAGCASAPPPPAAPAPPPSAPADLTPGNHVQVARQGQWYGAIIVQPTGDGRVIVHYDGTGNEYNEPVSSDRIKPFPAPGPVRDYRPGETVLVSFQNRLLVADVVAQVGPDQWRVHYNGFGPEAGENVGPDRLRRPFSGQSAHAVGEALVVDVSGQPLPGKVLAVSAADHWIVRFDSYGPQYDQEITADRIRTAPLGLGKPVAAPPAPPGPPGPPALPVQEKAGDKIEKGADKAKPKPAIDAGPGPQGGPPAVGENVLVRQHGAWFTASVTEVGAAGIKVKFASGGEATESPDHVLREPASLKGIQYTAGQLVLVEYKGVYVPARVLRPEGKDYKVRFDGFGPEADEVIFVRRLRPR
jgi:hypothetical protein